MTALIDLFNARQVLPLIEAGAAFTILMIFAAGRLSKLTAGGVLRDPGLYGVTGRMGRGKSYLLALAAWWSQRRSPPCCKRRQTGPRRALWANYNLTGAHYFTNWHEALQAPHGAMVLIDEAQLWWASSDHAAPTEVRQWITQLRKNHITALWASQDVTFVARWLRVLSFGIWECRRFHGGHRYTLVDPSQAGRDPKNQKTLARFRVKRRKKVMALYDTNETVIASREWGTQATEPDTPNPPRGQYQS